jgi:cellobiose phosphorylase
MVMNIKLLQTKIKLHRHLGNVIANSLFGTVVSESGSAYSWAINAHEYRITPWSNDPVSDTGGEAFIYVMKRQVISGLLRHFPKK